MTATTTDTTNYSVLFIPLQDVSGRAADILRHQFEANVNAGNLLPIEEWDEHTEITEVLTSGGFNWVAPHSTAPAAHGIALRIIGAAA